MEKKLCKAGMWPGMDCTCRRRCDHKKLVLVDPKQPEKGWKWSDE